MATFYARNAANSAWINFDDADGVYVRNAANSGWIDAKEGGFKVRNAANSAWIEYEGGVPAITSVQTTSGFTTILDAEDWPDLHQTVGGRSYGLWPDGPMNVYRGSDGTMYGILPNADNHRTTISHFNSQAGLAKPVRCYTSNFTRTEGLYDYTSWIFGAYAVGSTVYGYAHHEWYNYTVYNETLDRWYPKTGTEGGIEYSRRHCTRGIKWLKSTNNGAAFSQKSDTNANRLIVVPEPWNIEQWDGCYGWLHPSNCVKEGSYYYFFAQAYNLLDPPSDLLSTGVSLFRTTNLESSTAWQHWNGSGWTNRNSWQGNSSSNQPYMFFRTNNYNYITNNPGGHQHRAAQCIRWHVPTQQWLIFGYRGFSSPYFCFGRSATLASPQFETNGLTTICNSGGGVPGDYTDEHYINVFDPTYDSDQNFTNIGNTPICVVAEDHRIYKKQTLQINVS